jgi:hypothetical protein
MRQLISYVRQIKRSNEFSLLKLLGIERWFTTFRGQARYGYGNIDNAYTNTKRQKSLIEKDNMLIENNSFKRRIGYDGICLNVFLNNNVSLNNYIYTIRYKAYSSGRILLLLFGTSSLQEHSPINLDYRRYTDRILSYAIDIALCRLLLYRELDILIRESLFAIIVYRIY